MFFSLSEKKSFTDRENDYKPNFSIQRDHKFIKKSLKIINKVLTNGLLVSDLQFTGETPEELEDNIIDIIKNIILKMLQIPTQTTQQLKINLRKTYNELYLLLYLFFQYVIFTNQIQTYHEFIESPKRNASTTRDEMLKIIN